MTVAAAGSTVRRRARRGTPASRIPRSAITVVSRSSWVSTVTCPPARARSASTSSRTAFAAGPIPPESDNGRPTTTREAPASRAWARIVRRSTAGSLLRSMNEWGVATRPSGSDTARPIRLEPRSTPRTRPMRSESASDGGAADGLGGFPAYEGQGLVDLVDVGTAAHDDLGVFRRAPAEGLGSGGRDVGGRDSPTDQVVRDCDREAGFLLIRAHAHERDHAGADGVAGGEHEAPEVARVEPVAPGRDDAVGRVGRQRRRLGDCLPRPGRLDLVLQRLQLLLQLLDAVGQLRRRDLQRFGGPPQLALLVADAVDSGVAGDRFDPPEVRADRLLAHDLDRADEPERVDVRAATELHRVVAGFEDAHKVAVLLAEERDRADRLGVLARRLVVADGRVGDDLAVGERL